MRESFLRVGGPVALILAEAALQVSGIESLPLALLLLAGAAAWAVIALVTWEPVRRRLIYLALGREQLHVDPPTGVSPEVALREALRAYRDQGESLIGNGDPEMYARWARGVADFLTDEYGHERSALFIGEEGFGESGMASRLERLDELIREQEAQCLVDEVRSGRSSSHEG